ncbi:MAG: glycine--tRNA ligase subunit beta [Holosporales bacterium]|jgi:glycyl-tRNA synthetase beta chain
MPDLLFEARSEEIPAGLQANATKQVEALLPKALGEAGLPYNTIMVHHTPRRLIAIITGLPGEKPAQSVEKRGPRVDAPAAALEGFLSANKVSVEALEKRATDKGTFYFLNQHSPAQPLASILPQLLTNVLLGITWAKSQTWGAYTLKWGRPVRSVLAFLDNKPLSGSLAFSEAVSISFGTATVGARQHGSPSRTAASPAEYWSFLNEQGIIADSDKRREVIQKQGNALASSHNLTAEWHEGVLAEVVGLVETPAPILGTFDAAFLSLPPELLVSVMRTHQRYFPLYKDGALSNHFLVVANNQKPETHQAIIDGNQKVLRARFSDAQFYWESDKKITLEVHRQKLKSMVFHEKLGSVFDKSERLIKLLPNAFEARAAKADLASGTVREFPELQGIIGGYLINEAQRREDSATAVREHYLPLGPNSPLPSSTQGKTLALFDKLDSFYWLLAAGERPTGSRDPLGLRRLASAIVRLIDARPENDDLRFPDAWQQCHDSDPILAKQLNIDHDKIATLATELLVERAKDFLEEHYRVPPGVFLALLHGHRFGLKKLFSRATFIEAPMFAGIVETPTGQTTLALYKRVTNILHIEEKKDKKRHDDAVDEALLKTEPQETQTLYTRIVETQKYPDLKRLPDYFLYMAALADLAPFAANFFDAVLINDPDPILRANRLALLSLLRTLLESYADFSQIEG